MNTQQMINILERAKHEHYSEPEGLQSCEAANVLSPIGPCTCGADETNAEIDSVITELQLLEHARRISLKPSDVIVVQTPLVMPQNQSAHTVQSLAEVFPGHKVILLDGGATLSVVGKETT